MFNNAGVIISNIGLVEKIIALLVYPELDDIDIINKLRMENDYLIIEESNTNQGYHNPTLNRCFFFALNIGKYL